MSKKLYVLAALVMAVAITLSSVGGTYAKYTSTVATTATGTVAKWDISFKNGNSEAISSTIDLFKTAYTNVVANKIAPGTKGSYTFKVQNLSEVDAKAGLKFVVTNTSNIPIYITVDGSEPNASSTKLTDGSTVNLIADDTVLAKESASSTDITVKWVWLYEDNATGSGTAEENLAANDAADKAIGEYGTGSAPTISLAATLTAYQDAPTA